MIWYWHVAYDDEIFIDCDRYEKSIDHIRRRLQGAIEYSRLSVIHVESRDSLSPGHKHIIIRLDKPISPMERFAWELIFHSDIYRTASNMMRVSHGITAADILITDKIFSRTPQAQCTCEKKHNYEQMKICPAAMHLRGNDRTRGFFGRTSTNNCRFL